MHSMLGHPVGGPHHPDGYPADYLSTGPIDPGHDRDCAPRPATRTPTRRCP
jgi:hypothetical protein